jgi:molybdate transport system permease protein
MLAATGLTLALAGVTTAILLALGVPLAWGLARWRWWGAEAVFAAIALPLVLPPTVLGFYLLLLLGPHGPFQPLLHLLGRRSLAFSFSGLVIGSVVYSLPFMVQPVQAAFAALGETYLEAAATLRASPARAFFTIALPLARGAIFTGALLSFAHTLGEFGVVLMLGGDIPGRTEVLSIRIFDDVETMHWHEAAQIAAGMAIVSFAVLLAMRLLVRRGYAA